MSYRKSPELAASAGRAAACGDRRDVRVALPGGGYMVSIGPGVRHGAEDALRALGARSAVVVSARPDSWLPDLHMPHHIVRIRDGERQKSLGKVERLCREFAIRGITRADAVVSCGGGTTTDVVGLAAALYHRGIPVVHLPTSLLAQADASVGGKTAVNLPEAKNVVGCYWQPAAVLCDTEYLGTLPRREWLNGYGEIARGHFIGTGDLRGRNLLDQITTCVALKARIVACDPRGDGLRHLLNYGHTLGHALERCTDFRIRHGEAVAIGTVFAGLLAGRLGRVGAARVREHREVVADYGLPTALPATVKASDLIRVMALDKKSVDGLTFILDGPRGPELVSGVPTAAVSAALADMPRRRRGICRLGADDEHGPRARDARSRQALGRQ
jgi:5-deoxy-5-amino-3-dehydroquinate synthase